jgi:soluble cytochrome b562
MGTGTTSRLAALLLVAGLALVAACSGGGDDKKGARLSDCEYAKQVQDIVSRFVTNVEEVGNDLQSSSTSSTNTAKDQAKKAFDTLDSELGKAISDLKGLNVSGDVDKVNKEFISGFEDFRKNIPNAKKQLDSGEFEKAGKSVEDAGSDVEKRFDGLDTKYPDLIKRFQSCT